MMDCRMRSVTSQRWSSGGPKGCVPHRKVPWLLQKYLKACGGLPYPTKNTNSPRTVGSCYDFNRNLCPPEAVDVWKQAVNSPRSSGFRG